MLEMQFNFPLIHQSLKEETKALINQYNLCKYLASIDVLLYNQTPNMEGSYTLCVIRLPNY